MHTHTHARVRALLSHTIHVICDPSTPLLSPCVQVESPRHFFIHLLLKRPQTLWDTQFVAKKPSQLVEWERCSEYFEFRAQLLQNLYG